MSHTHEKNLLGTVFFSDYILEGKEGRDIKGKIVLFSFGINKVQEGYSDLDTNILFSDYLKFTTYLEWIELKEVNTNFMSCDSNTLIAAWKDFKDNSETKQIHNLLKNNGINRPTAQAYHITHITHKNKIVRMFFVFLENASLSNLFRKVGISFKKA